MLLLAGLDLQLTFFFGVLELDIPEGVACSEHHVIARKLPSEVSKSNGAGLCAHRFDFNCFHVVVGVFRLLNVDGLHRCAVRHTLPRQSP